MTPVLALRALFSPSVKSVPGENTRKLNEDDDMTTRSSCSFLFDKRFSREHTTRTTLVFVVLKPGGEIGLIGENVQEASTLRPSTQCHCNGYEIQTRYAAPAGDHGGRRR